MSGKQREFLRFCAVGGVNTLVDIALFVLLVNLSFGVFTANIGSTSAALMVSLALNARFTFRVKQLQHKQIVAYVMITLLGLWVLQPFVIIGTLSAMALLPFTFSLSSGTTLLVAKVTAISVTTVWNYYWYSRVVFNQNAAQ